MAFPEFTYADSALNAASGADEILVTTPWPEFAETRPTAVEEVAASMTVVDTCQGIDATKWNEAGWRVLSFVGNYAGARRISWPSSGLSSVTSGYNR